MRQSAEHNRQETPEASGKEEMPLGEATTLCLSPRDQELLIRALQEEKIVQPGSFLRALAKEYAARVESR